MDATGVKGAAFWQPALQRSAQGCTTYVTHIAVEAPQVSRRIGSNRAMPGWTWQKLGISADKCRTGTSSLGRNARCMGPALGPKPAYTRRTRPRLIDVGHSTLHRRYAIPF